MMHATRQKPAYSALLRTLFVVYVTLMWITDLAAVNVLKCITWWGLFIVCTSRVVITRRQVRQHDIQKPF